MLPKLNHSEWKEVAWPDGAWVERFGQLAPEHKVRRVPTWAIKTAKRWPMSASALNPQLGRGA